MFGLFRKKRDTNVTIYDGREAHQEAGLVAGRNVTLYRPPVQLDANGHSMPGVNKDLIGRYLVSTISMLAETNVGQVTVDWRAQQGRFVLTRFTIHAWDQFIDVLHPVAVVSQEVANIMDVYRAGISFKARELHKGHQEFTQANRLLRRAYAGMVRLHDDDITHVNDAEYLFILASLQEALVLSALVPVAPGEPEQVVGTRLVV